MAKNESESYAFGEFVVDPVERFLFQNGAAVPVPPKAFDLLLVLVRSSGRVLDKRELMKAVWPDTFVEEGNLAQNISLLRKALSDSGDEPLYIQTLPRRGYRFIANVRNCPYETGPPSRSVQAAITAPESIPSRQAWFVRHWMVIRTGLVCIVATGLLVSPSILITRKEVAYEQITNLSDSAVAPALSPDGRIVAFIRGDEWFLTTEDIYLKWLPQGEPVRLTHDGRPKFAPAFSPDGSQLTYSSVEPSKSAWSTMITSVLGGEPRLLFSNAEGLTWLDARHFLFSEIKSGVHMAVVTAGENRAGSRDVYVPNHERSMAHFSYASPSRKWALVIEMDRTSAWQRCRLVPLDGSSPGSQVGPPGPCTAAAWSPDGNWMYFSVNIDGAKHIWRQRFPNGTPEQITFGTTEEEGIAVAPDGKSLITSIGMRQSAIWLHDAKGDRPLSSEGFASRPSFSPEGTRVYYLSRRDSRAAPQELLFVDLRTGVHETVLHGFSIATYDLSPDGKQVVFAAGTGDRKSQLWLAPLDRSSAPRQLTSSGEDQPYFGPDGDILYRSSEGDNNFLYRINRDGSGRAKAVPYPILNSFSISPDRRFIGALMALRSPGPSFALMAVPTDGGIPRRICTGFCVANWSPDGRLLYVGYSSGSSLQFDQLVAIPVPLGDSLPVLPSSGIGSVREAIEIAGGRPVATGFAATTKANIDFSPGPSSMFAFVKERVQRNLFRVLLP
jgi:DNA-binding winged helix-turn-helix (wHTH) protein/Tol biopolymer transport system component